MVKGYYTCLCGERGEIRQVKGRLAPYCPKCTYNFQSKHGQETLKGKMVPVNDEPELPETPAPVEPESPEMETPAKPEKKPFRLFG